MNIPPGLEAKSMALVTVALGWWFDPMIPFIARMFDGCQ